MRQNVVTVKGFPEWKAWVEELATADRKTVSDLVDAALLDYARKIGFAKQPPIR